jgi:hypothetical protein
VLQTVRGDQRSTEHKRTDHRRSDDATLLNALRDRDPLALAEAYHRTVLAANACARRLLSSPDRIETLLETVYRELWEDPPENVSLEGWVRARCFALGTQDLRQRETAPASPSVSALLPDLPAPDVRYLDAAERALSELDDHDRNVLLLAHDCGVNTETQGGDAAQALERSLRALAGPEPSSADSAALRDDPCSDVRGMGDWVLGLSDERSAAELEALVAARAGCAALARTLRRGRRRLEGLPPTPDMGHRILVTVLASAPPEPASSIAHGHGQQDVLADHTAAWGRTVEQPALADPAEIVTGEMHPQEPHRGKAEATQRGGDTITSTEWRSPEAVAPNSRRPRVVRLPNDEDTGGIESHRRSDPYAQLAQLDDLDDDLRLPDPHQVGPGLDAPFRTDPSERDFSGRDFSGRDFSGRDFSGRDFSGRDFSGRDFSGRDPSEIDPSETDEEQEDFESLYPEEELITRPSAGQRLLVVIGYVVPIILGAGLGLYIADMLFNLNR